MNKLSGDQEVSPVNFNIKYDGEGLKDHSINVRDLAPVLLSVGEVFDALNFLYNKKNAKIAVNVKAYAPGSFHILFDVYQQVICAPAFLLFADNQITAALNLMQILFGGTGKGVVGGLFGLIKQTKGKKIIRSEELSPGMFRISTDENTYDVPVELLKSYQDLTVRRALDGFVRAPLQKGGISSVSIEEGGKEIIKVDESEAEYYRCPSVDEDILTDETRKAAYSIIDLSFKEDGTWTLLDDNKNIKVHIEDNDFINKVNNSEISFSKSDISVCEVHVVQKRSGRGIETKYTVKKVLKHIPAPRTLSLPRLE